MKLCPSAATCIAFLGRHRAVHGHWAGLGGCQEPPQNRWQRPKPSTRLSGAAMVFQRLGACLGAPRDSRTRDPLDSRLAAPARQGLGPRARSPASPQDAKEWGGGGPRVSARCGRALSGTQLRCRLIPSEDATIVVDERRRRNSTGAHTSEVAEGDRHAHERGCGGRAAQLGGKWSASESETGPLRAADTSTVIDALSTPPARRP